MIAIGNDLFTLLDKIGDDLSMEILNLDANANIKNPLGISRLNVSQSDWMFEATIGKKVGNIKIGTFIREFFAGEYSEETILLFSKIYNKEKAALFGWGKKYEQPAKKLTTPINVVAKKADYKNVRETFLSLVTETYPYGEEDNLRHLLPELSLDKFGNYYKIIGKSTTMFASHLDTASYKKSSVKLFSYKEEDSEIICTDNKTILGADDKAGVTIMLHMIEHNIPGVYYFFLGEERGCVGSSAVASELESFPFLDNISKVISFDRRNYNSVITEQMGGVCCSDTFAKTLCSELNKGGLKMAMDPTGILTDSACFMDDMPEITNVSVGYFNEHTTREIQNITFLEKLGKAVLNVNWEGLPVTRKAGISADMLQKFRGAISDTKKYSYETDNALKVLGDGNNVILQLNVTEVSFDMLYQDINRLNGILTQYSIDSDVTFDGSRIKIKIK